MVRRKKGIHAAIGLFPLVSQVLEGQIVTAQLGILPLPVTTTIRATLPAQITCNIRNI